MKNVVLLLSAGLFLAGCENVDKGLWDQNYAKVEKVKSIPPPAGAVPMLGSNRKIDYGQVDIKTIVPPFPLDVTSAYRGKGMYDIYCSPCHGLTGEADTRIAKKMDLAPPPLTSDKVKKEFKDAEIFVKILANDSLMPKYRAELDDNEAWDIVAYVRTLPGGGK